MTNHNTPDQRRPLTGCGMIAIGFLIAFGIAALYVLVQFGSWLGSL